MAANEGNLKFIPFTARGYSIQFVFSRSFEKESRRIFSPDEMTGLMNYLAAYPNEGDRIPGTNGLRKMRWKAKGSGKRGGARVIYYFRDLNMPLIILSVYAKSERCNLTKRQLAEVERRVEMMIDIFLENESSATAVS
jgi:mRNA-degrading endonuclease RelE of RelBE toxin-antitoxin system